MIPGDYMLDPPDDMDEPIEESEPEPDWDDAEEYERSCATADRLMDEDQADEREGWMDCDDEEAAQ